MLFSFILLISLVATIRSYNEPKTFHFQKGGLSFKRELRAIDISSKLNLIPVPLKSQDTFPSTFSATVDLETSKKSDSDFSVHHQMLIIISTNETVLSIRGDSFQAYPCTPPCSYTSEVINPIVLPYFTASNGHRASNIPISIANSTWSLDTDAILIEDLLVSYPYVPTDFSHVLGWIGLGTDGDAMKNFKTDHPLFSISFSDITGEAGELLFANHTTKADAARRVGFYPSDPNWQMTVVGLSFNGTNLTMVRPNTTMIFDLQFGNAALESSTAFRLPSTTFFSFAQAIAHFMKTTSITDKLNDMPDLVIILSDGSRLPIPSYIYLKENDELYQDNYDYVSGEEDYIILGWPMLANYYTVFERINDTSVIGLYISEARASANTKDVVSPSDSFFKHKIVWVSLVGVLVIAVGIFANKKCQKKKVMNMVAKDETLKISLKNDTEEDDLYTQASSMVL